MSDFAVWPYFACLTVLVACASLPCFAFLDDAIPASPGDGAGRRPGIDGLRGLLAVSVMICHAGYLHNQRLHAEWDVPGEFHKETGRIAVGLFFMITGFLFWSRVLRDQGRLDWVRLYVGRLFRIGPVYFVLMLIVFAVAADRTGFRLAVPVPELLGEVGQWLGLGLLGNPDLNGCACSGGTLGGMTWTLWYEWVFYLALPLGALFVRRFGWTVLTSALFAGLALAGLALLDDESAGSSQPASLFALGMLSATITAAHKGVIVGRAMDRAASILVAGLLAMCFMGLPTWSGALKLMLMGVVFQSIVMGCSLFGVLNSRGARRLGAVSYGIYLLHGAVLLAVFALPGVGALDAASGAGHWTVVLLCAMALVIVAAVVHVAVERPGMVMGRRVCRRLGSRAGRSQARAVTSAAVRVT